MLHLRQGRWALLAAGLGTSAAIAVAAGIAPKVAPAAAVSMAPPPTTAQQEAGMTPGLPLAKPAALNVTTPRTLRLRLVAKPKRFDISGKRVWGESYNGHYVGPTLHLVPGEHVVLTLVNRLTTPTNLHFHGLNVSPSGRADNPEISVLPGHSFNYHLYIPLDQPLGTFWYHDHDMCMGNETMHMTGMTASAMTGTAPTAPKGCQDVETQIYDGLAGTIIVGDDRALLPRPLRHVATRTLALTDMQISQRRPHRGEHPELFDLLPTTRRYGWSTASSSRSSTCGLARPSCGASPTRERTSSTTSSSPATRSPLSDATATRFHE